MPAELKKDPRLTALGNGVSDAVHKALSAGVPVDEAASVLAKVAADYWRVTYGPGRLSKLAQIIVLSAEEPLPGQH